MVGRMDRQTAGHTDHQNEWRQIFLDPENIVVGTKIIILCALVQKLWSQACFCAMSANIMHLYLANIQTAKNSEIGQDLS